MGAEALRARALPGLPEIGAGDDLAGMIVAANTLRTGDVVVVAQKAISKVEGAVRALDEITADSRALELAGRGFGGGDARLVQLVLDESAEILRAQRGVLITVTHHGLICANAGVDRSNAAPGTAIVLPRDPDRSARELRAALRERTGARTAVVVSDSFGRAWRNGQCDVAIGCAGIVPLDDWRGRTDGAGRELQATWLAVADMIAAVADLARAKDSREPVVVVEGLERFVCDDDGPGAVALLRPLEEDLFR